MGTAAAMPTVTVELPSMLTSLAGVPPRVQIDAARLSEVLDRLVERYPTLGVHLFDEHGTLREHVLCLHNGANSRWLDSLDVPVRRRDTVTILQAVSGG